MEERSPQPGPKQPGKYPVQPGPKYDYYGEQQGWIYNPYSDEYMPDPATSQAWGEEVGLIEPEEKPPGLGEQLLPVAATAGTMYAAQELGKEAVGGGLYDTVSGWFGGGEAATTATEAAQGAMSGGQTASQLPGFMSTSTNAASSGAYPVGTAVDGSVMMSDGTTQAANSGFMSGYGQVGGGPINYLGPVGMAAGGYGMAQAYESGDELSGALSGATFGAGAAGTAALMGANLGSISMLGVTLGPVGWLAVGGALIGASLGLMGGHKSTKQIQAERRNALIKGGNQYFQQFTDITAKSAADYVKEKADVLDDRGVRTDLGDDFIGFDDDGRWVNNKYIRTHNEADLRPQDAWGSMGVFETFGGDKWLTDTTEDQRYQITEQLLNEGLLKGDKGDLIIFSDDQARAREIYDSVKSQAPEEEQQDDQSN